MFINTTEQEGASGHKFLKLLAANKKLKSDRTVPSTEMG
jgi:hypothetical protein